MSIVKYQNNRLKFCGISILKISRTKICVLGIPVIRCSSWLSGLYKRFKANRSFDTKVFDKEILSIIPADELSSRPINPHRVAFLATVLSDMGGHSKCVQQLVNSLAGRYEQKLYLTQKSETYSSAPETIRQLEQYAEVEGVNAGPVNLKGKVRKIADSIRDYAPKALFAYIHPDDVLGTAVIACLKKETKIRIVYFNHASHFPVLGMSFADIILEGLPSAQKVTNEQRGFSNTKLIGLQSIAREQTRYISPQERKEIRSQWGISESSPVTLSGAASYKFFDKDRSPYFEMIKELLEKDSRLVHVMISEFSGKQERVISEIFKESEEARKRLIIIPYQKDFDRCFQCADVFIDSFPVSSALTQVDLMRNRVASVVKINKEIPEYSFHEYQMPDYPYMHEDVEDMKRSVWELLYDKDKREEIIDRNYKYWLQTYESSVVRDRYIKIIEEG